MLYRVILTSIIHHYTHPFKNDRLYFNIFKLQQEKDILTAISEVDIFKVVMRTVGWQQQVPLEAENRMSRESRTGLATNEYLSD